MTDTTPYIETNPELDLAWRCVESTGTSLFLTGRAGTGKTTFLRRLKERSPKRMVVLAPTGIAAINAGGVTIHSFFQLPFAPYVPGSDYSLGQQYRLRKEKIDIIRSMDLLVIDEISMVRADLLDLVDVVLRRYRNGSKPFGGVQLLMIGDLQQLSPVLKEPERALLAEYYDSPFFFGSHALRQTHFVTIELKFVFRQKDAYFLDLLNAIRDNRLDQNLFDALNQRYVPDFQPKEGEEYIRLMTHNRQVQQVNDEFLSKIAADEFRYSASVKGTFPESAFPANADLVLKEGAQVMFIKNDISGEQRYFNGKIGRVLHLGDSEIEVLCAGETLPVKVERGEWTNCRYVLDSESKEIREEIDGTFEQYPLRLAWAITIHKSQGLTFDRAIIDASASFAHGQVYVALSRCRTLEGIVLSSRLAAPSIRRDRGVEDFNQYQAYAPNEEQMLSLERSYYQELLVEQFDFAQLFNQLQRMKRLSSEFAADIYPKVHERLIQTIEKCDEAIMNVAANFNRFIISQLNQGIAPQANTAFQQRVVAGAHYFAEQLQSLLLPFVPELELELDNKENQKSWSDALKRFVDQLRLKLSTLNRMPETGFSVVPYLDARAKASISDDEKKAKKAPKTKKKALPEAATSTDDDELNQQLFEHLRAWRKALSTEMNVPAYTILHQKALVGIAVAQPRDGAELLAIAHIGKVTVEKYGVDILNIVDEFRH